MTESGSGRNFSLAGTGNRGQGPVSKRVRLSPGEEKQRGLSNLLEAVIQVRERAENGSLGSGRTAEEWLLAANVLIDCPLPFRPTRERQVTRRTRFHGTFVTVTFTAHRPGVDLPTATDSRLLHWLLNRVVRAAKEAENRGDTPSRVVEWNSAYEYLMDSGKTICAKNYKDLRASFSRIAGLSITLERQDEAGDLGLHTSFLESWYLPPSLDRASKRPSDEQAAPYGVALSDAVIRTIAKHFVAIPIAIWKLSKGRPLQGSLLIWAYKRAYTAAGTSLISWELLRDQFGIEDSNPRRLKPLTRRTVRLLQTMWPGCGVEVLAGGIRFSQQSESFLQRSSNAGVKSARRTRSPKSLAPGR